MEMEEGKKGILTRIGQWKRVNSILQRNENLNEFGWGKGKGKLEEGMTGGEIKRGKGNGRWMTRILVGGADLQADKN